MQRDVSEDLKKGSGLGGDFRGKRKQKNDKKMSTQPTSIPILMSRIKRRNKENTNLN